MASGSKRSYARGPLHLPHVPLTALSLLWQLLSPVCLRECLSHSALGLLGQVGW